MQKNNLKTLANKLGVSVSTVSKALRGSHEIGCDTTKRVLEMAEKMGYRTNPYAGHLRNHISKTIAVIIPEMTNNFFIQAITGAESIAQEKNYHILVYITHDDYNKEVSIMKHLQNGRVDGVLMSLSASTQNYDHLNKLIELNIPIVFFDRIGHEIETAKIITDDFASGFNATEHLIKNGCRDIAYLSVSENLSIDNKRKQGYIEALNKYDIKINPARIIKCGVDENYNYKTIKRLLNGKNVPDGIFASIEKLALTSYAVCNGLKIKIPDQIKIICFSNLITADLLNPSLTTITQPAFEMGKQAATVLFKYLDKKRTDIPNQNIVIKSELIKRNS
ncbi:MAG TPA: LacI family DNA-binding transcriptional regulator, partial [Flavipsychrobacter sp.]|nr:LacI family DNA-binding transcriptional regulator [Flavipsychrobacter sp.]